LIVLGFIQLLEIEGFETNPPIINGRQFIWKVKANGCTLVFLDTANYGISSVRDLGLHYNEGKGQVDFSSVDNDTLMRYCIHDTELLEQFMIDFVSFVVTHNLGAFKYTIASQAMTAFRTTFMDTAPFIHDHKPSLRLERSAYHGGRTEAFYIGHKNHSQYYKLDVNSMYPYAMVQSELPIELMGYTENVPVSYLQHRLKRWYVIADVTLHIDKPAFCVIRNGKLVFPIGEYRTCLHHAELEYLLTNGTVLHIHRCAIYKKGRLFDKYVQTFYQLKNLYGLQKLSSWRYITKLFLNSLYGKFGQKEPHREYLGTVDYPGIMRIPVLDLDSGVSGSELYWYGNHYREYKEGETRFSCPAIAGAITAVARMRLFELIELAGLENVLYVDTDSLIVNSIGYERLTSQCDNERLGYLKLEDTDNQVTIFGAKDYEFAGHTHKKGVPLSAKELTVDSWEYEQFLGFITWMNGGASDTMHTLTRTKHRKSSYDKGEVTSTGQVLPHRYTTKNYYPQSIEPLAVS